jgi:hypothetical protein
MHCANSGYAPFLRGLPEATSESRYPIINKANCL